MSKRPSQEAWAEARARWEADPKESFESIAQWLGVTRAAVSRKAKAAPVWEKVKSLRKIVEQAHLQADKVSAAGQKVSDGTSKSPVAAAVDIRSDVLERHRADWDQHRKLFGLSAIADDFEAGKKAKISAEMLLLRQKGESAAYGLDAPDTDTDQEMSELPDDELERRISAKLARINASAATA